MAISYFEERRTFLLQGKNSTYAITIAKDNSVQHNHWGGKLLDVRDVPATSGLGGVRSHADDFQEYRAWGGSSKITPALKVTYPDGARAAFLRYVSHEIDGDTLAITMKDPFYPLTVVAHYRVCEDFDVIERYSTIKNEGDGDVTVESVYSANWHLPRRDSYRLTYLAGAYNREFQKKQELLQEGRKVLESRTGLAGQDSVAFYLLDDGASTEDAGEVYYGCLDWSGNWQMIFETDCDGRTIVTGGISEFDFEYCLEPGQEYTTPMFLGGYTDRGFGDATRKFHRYERAEIIHPTERDRILPVIYNTHGSLINDTNEENVMKEIEIAHEHGIELFVHDGGWTGYHDIFSEENKGQPHRYGYGTWEVNKIRYPRGLKPLADRCHELGMKFGLWIEPETVHYKNRIADEHPEWLLGYDGRKPEISGWGCYNLNLANDEALAYMTEVLINLVRENDIDYIKNDFNRYMLHMGWQGVERKHQKEVWDKYVKNMWKLYTALKEEFPDLIFENSAGGGKRGDIGMLRFSGRMHRSDNQDMMDSIRMHEGMTYFVPSKFAGGACFISDDYGQLVNRRFTSIEYQAHVAMLSGVSVSLKFAELEQWRRDELKRQLELNKEIRHTVQMGDMYRLVSAYEKEYAAYEFLEEDKSRAVLFLLGQNMQFGRVPERVRLKDLDPDKRYKVTGHGTYWKYPTTRPEAKTEVPERIKDYGTFTGRGLMNVGLRFKLVGHAASEILVIDEVTE